MSQLDDQNPETTECQEQRVRELHHCVDRLERTVHGMKRTQKALRRTQRCLAVAERLAHLGSYESDFVEGTIVWSDENYRIHDWNPRQPPPSVTEYREKIIHPADRERFEERFQRMIRERKTTVGEYRIVTARGTTKIFEIVEHPEFDRSGKLVKSFGAVLDITERRRFEETMRENAIRMAEAERLAHLGSWEEDLATQRITWSEETFRIVGRDPASGPPSFEEYRDTIVHPEDRNKLDRQIRHLVATKQQIATEYRIITPQGKTRILEDVGFPLVDAEGALVKIFGAVLDVTEHVEEKKAIRKSESRMAEAERLAHLGSYEVDYQTGIAYWSDETFRILGRDPALGPPNVEEYLSKYVYPDDRPIFAHIMDQMFKGQRRQETVYRVITTSGEVKVLNSVLLPVLDSTGKVLKAYGAILDITESKRVEGELRESEARYRALVESSQDFIFQIDSHGRFLYMNPAGLAELKQSLPRVVGQSLEALFGPTAGAIFSRALKQVVKSAEAQRTELEVTINERFRVLNTTVAPVISKKGRVECVVGIARDITERKHAEEDLRRSHALLAQAESLAHLGCFSVEFPSHRIVWSAEACRILGRDPALAGPTSHEYFTQIVHPDDRALVQKLYQGFNKQRRPVHAEYRIINPDGVIKWLETKGQGAFDKKKHFVGFFGTILDITERKHSEERLRRSNELLAEAEAVVHLGYFQAEYPSFQSTWSPEALRIFGLPPSSPGPSSQEFTSKIIHPDDRAYFQAKFDEFLRKPEPQRLEYRIVTPNGNIKWVDASVRPALDKSGHLTGFFGAFLDITARKQAEQEREQLLSEVQRRASALDATINAIAEGVAIYRPDGEAFAINPSALRILGYSADERRLPLKERIARRRVETLDGKPLPIDEAPPLRALRGETIRNVEYRYYLPDKRVIYISNSASPIRTPDGTVIGAVVTLVDITGKIEAAQERERLLAEVRDERNRLQVLLDTAPVGINFYSTPDGRLAFSNKAAETITGRPPRYDVDVRDLVAYYGVRLPNGEALPPDQVPAARSLRGEVVSGVELVIRHPSGRDVYLLNNSVPVRDAEGQIIGAFVVYQDITERRQNEEALRRSHDRLAEAEALVHLGSYQVEYSSGKVLWADETFRIIGRDPALGAPSMEEYTFKIVHPDDRAYFEKVYGEFLKTKIPFHFEYRILTPAGITKWLESVGKGIYDKSGALVGFVGTILDITARKQAEQEREQLLSEVQRRASVLDATIDAMAEGIVIYSANGEAVIMNPAARRILGYSAKELEMPLAQRIARLRSETLDGKKLSPQETPPMRALRGEVVRDYEQVFHHLSKHAVYTTSTAAPIRTPQGEIIGAVASISDTTERVEAQKERERLLAEVQLRATELDATLNAMPDGLFIVDARGEIVRFNEAGQRMLGMSFEKMHSLGVAGRGKLFVYGEGDAVGEPVPPRELPTMRGLRGEIVTNEHVIYYHPNGSVLHLQVSGSPIRNARDQIIGSVTSYSDITQLIELQEWQQRLASIVAHDLRQPLTAIQGQSQLVARSLKAQHPDLALKSNEAVIVSAKRMNVMIQDLVDSVRLEAGHFELQPSALDLRPFLDDLLHRNVTVMEVSRVHLFIPSDMPPVFADPDRLERIFVNLISNALKYSESPKPVEIRARTQDGWALIEVEDHGQGIASGDISHLFQRFFRAKRTKKKESIGLGLYITKLMVEAHNGTISVRSQVGKGSTFGFTIPLAAKSAPH